MTFMAGIVDFQNGLSIKNKSSFSNALDSVQTRLPWKLDKKVTKSFILAHAGFDNLWQGPKIISKPDYTAACTGVQWKNINNKTGAIAYLKSFFCDGMALGDYFDYFGFAIVIAKEKSVILATDPLGISPVFYALKSNSIVFSSHQTFLRDFFSNNLQIDLQAVSEYLIIGHNIGDKSLLKNVQIVPGSSCIIYKNRSLVIKKYYETSNLMIDKKISTEEAAKNVLDHLNNKFKNYDNLLSRDYCSLLSGGWDSRLIASMLSEQNKLQISYSTQQQMNRFKGILISEKKIAYEVARFLNIKNEYIEYELPESGKLVEWLWFMDFSTWFGHWAIALAERLPFDHFTIVDGLAGDIYFRGSRFNEKLIEHMSRGEKEKSIEMVTRDYLNGIHFFTPGVDEWKNVIDEKQIRSFKEFLKYDIARQIGGIIGEDFITPFFVRNRIGRGTAIAQRLIFGRKAAVALPFCSLSITELALSLPAEMKFDNSLYVMILEKSRKNLSKIASTNTTVYDEIKDYLILPSINDRVVYSAKEFAKKHFTKFYQLSKKIKQKISNQVHPIVKNNEFVGILDRFSSFLSDEIKRAIMSNNYASIRKYYEFLNKISQLNKFYEGHSK